MKKLITAIFFSALCGLSVSSAVAQTLQKFRIGYPSISSRQAQLWIAKDEGIFRKHGLDVESSSTRWRGVISNNSTSVA